MCAYFYPAFQTTSTSMTLTNLFHIPDEKTDADFVETVQAEHEIGRLEKWVGHGTWYDTFDWKLHRKGHELVFRRRVKDAGLELLGQSSKASACSIACASTPQFAQDLPDSPMRTALERLAKRRALIPCVSADLVLQSTSIRDTNGKTIARLRLESASVEVGPRSPALRLRWARISAVRGYEQALHQLSANLEDAGFQAHISSVLEAMMKGHRRSPGDYRSKPEFWLNPAMRSDMAVMAILDELQDKMDANEHGVIEDIDQDFLKHFRVAIRRSRSALSLFKSSLPNSGLMAFRKQWQDLGRQAGHVRDLDVLLNLISDHLDSIDASDRAALTPLSEYIVQTRDWRRAELITTLQSPEYHQLRQDWRTALAPQTKVTNGAVQAQKPVQVLAASSIAKAHRRLIRDGKLIKKKSEPDALHDLRKQAKKMRYVLEFFSSLYAPSVMEHVLTPLQTLQDILGSFQDLEVQKLELRKAADQLSRGRNPHAETYLALGRLLATMDTEKRAARSAFKLAFEDLLAAPYSQAIEQLSCVKS